MQSMLLAIDIGNTNITTGVFQNNTLIKQFRVSTNDISSFTDIIISLDNITGAIMASVVPKVDTDIHKNLKQAFNIDIYNVSRETLPHFKTNLQNPDEVGADRLVNYFYAIHQGNYPAIIIDFGTATTFDVIDTNKVYLGGVIAPGINLSIKTLADATAKLPKIKLHKQSNVIGNNTKDAINSGLYNGYIELINGINRRIKHELGVESLKIIATGGLANIFADEIDNLTYIEPDLTLKGLNLIYNYNNK